ncbi:MAG TPA: cytochrome c oxidase assembly protein [Gaiellaceae bacterium]
MLALATPWTFSFDPLQVVPVLVVTVLYARRCVTLARRGRPVPGWRQFSFYVGIALLLFAFVSPVDALGEERLLSMHMTQHLLLGDLAPLALVLGVNGPVLRPVLALPVIGSLRVLAHPLVALPLWALNLYLWHLEPLYEAALEHNTIHALEHFTFFVCGCLVWAAVVEPLPGPAWFTTGWKALYVLVVRLLGTVLANVFLWSGGVFYPRYAEAPRLWGLSATADQRIAGGVMMVEGSLVTIGVFAWMFLRWAAESERRQQLVEQGEDPAAATRAVRYGRA